MSLRQASLRKSLGSKHTLLLSSFLIQIGNTQIIHFCYHIHIFKLIHFRAELASDEFIPVADVILENIVILKKNPDY